MRVIIYGPPKIKSNKQHHLLLNEFIMLSHKEKLHLEGVYAERNTYGEELRIVAYGEGLYIERSYAWRGVAYEKKLGYRWRRVIQGVHTEKRYTWRVLYMKKNDVWKGVIDGGIYTRTHRKGLYMKRNYTSKEFIRRRVQRRVIHRKR